jgi:exopolyphosphatase / guanosine-5'-triphosphate,3'-diphosphate pyrophosphatase
MKKAEIQLQRGMMNKHVCFDLNLRVAALITLVIFMLAGCSSAPIAKEDACLKRRGAIDIGSGSTKAFAAIVDVCQTPKRMVEKLFDEKVKISFGESVEESTGKEFSPGVITDAAAKIATFVEQMNAQNLESIDLVATAAFRKARNGVAAANTISDAVVARVKGSTRLSPESLRIQILTQEREAEIGARSAVSNLQASSAAEVPQTLIVWDIGGGSMQMYALDPTHPSSRPTLFTGDLASVTFKNLVIKDVLKKDPTAMKSPNPLNPTIKSKNGKKAVALSRAHAEKNVPNFFKQNGGGARWVGIGGVLAISVQKQVDHERDGSARRESYFTEKDLMKTFEARATRKDEEIESDYRETEVTNLALVLGYMQELKIEKVETVEASLTQGLISR